MSVKERLLRGLAASTLGKVVSIAAQILAIPALAHAWGIELYGQYLVAMALAGFLSYSTMNIHQPCLAALSMAHSRGDEKRFRTVGSGMLIWVYATTFVAFIVYLMVAANWTHIPLSSALKGAHFPVFYTLSCMGIQQILLQQLGVATTLLGARGRYADSIIIESGRNGFDAVSASTIAMVLSRGPETVSTVSVLITVITTLVAWVRVLGLSPRSGPLFLLPAWNDFRAMPRAVAGNFAISSCLQFMLYQLPRLILGYYAGAQAVALFAVAWSLMNAARQVFDILVAPLSVELSYSFSSGRKDRTASMLGGGSCLSFATSLAALPFVYFIGGHAVRIITGQHFAPSSTILIVLWGAMAIYSLSVCFQTALLSANSGYRAALPVLFSALCATGVSVLATSRAGPAGAAVGLLIFQGLFSAVVVRTVMVVFALNYIDLIRGVAQAARALRSMSLNRDQVADSQER